MDKYGNIWKYMEIYGNIWKYMEITSNHRLTTIGSFFININRLGCADFKTKVAIYLYFHFFDSCRFLREVVTFLHCQEIKHESVWNLPSSKSEQKTILRRIQISEEVKYCFVIHVSDFILKSRN